MPPEPNANLRKLLSDALKTDASYHTRADAIEAAAVRIARRMMAADETWKDDSFFSNEELYGNGFGSYLTNAQGLVGVLLPFIEVESATLEADELVKIRRAAESVVREASESRRRKDARFTLHPYVGQGSFNKLLASHFRDTRATFYSTNGVAWSLSSLVLLYYAHLLGKVPLSDGFEKDVIGAIEHTYGLLLELFQHDEGSGRAGWGWCSLHRAPDLYNTWSASQTLGDLDDYVFSPESDSILKGNANLLQLARRLREITPPDLLPGDARTPTDLIYRKCCRWLYKELNERDSAAIRELIEHGQNAQENEIYFTFFLIESLVYMKADVLLTSEVDVRNTLYAKLLDASSRLARLRDSAWYVDGELSTLTLPLMFKENLGLEDKLREPSLEPLVLRALSYAPQFLDKSDISDHVNAALQRHAGVLNPALELWDMNSINFLICERTVEALLMVRNMFRKFATTSVLPTFTGSATDRRSALVLTVPAEETSRLVDQLLERLREPMREYIDRAVAAAASLRLEVAATPVSGDGDESIMTLVNPMLYGEILASDKVLLYLDGKLGKNADEHAYKIMLMETVVSLLTAVLRRMRPHQPDAVAPQPPSRSEELADGFARAVAGILPRAMAYYLEDRLRRASDLEGVGDLQTRFDPARIEDQIERLALTYLGQEFEHKLPLDVEGLLARTLDATPERGGGGQH